jgi:hypothetical protein
MLRIPHCLDSRLKDGGKVVSLTHPPHFTPQKHYYFNASETIEYLGTGCTSSGLSSSTQLHLGINTLFYLIPATGFDSCFWTIFRRIHTQVAR